MITTWYLQSQRTWDKLCHSCIGSSLLPRGAFPEGRAYAFPQRLHAGSLEALRVSRPEAVVLALNNYQISLERFPKRGSMSEVQDPSAWNRSRFARVSGPPPARL